MLKNLFTKETRHTLPKDMVIEGHKITFLKVLDAVPDKYFVSLVKDTESGEFYSLKHILVLEDEIFDKIDKEIDVLKVIHGKQGIISFYGSSMTTPSRGSKMASLYMLLELGADTLSGYISRRVNVDKNPLSEIEILGLFLDVAEGVRVAHEMIPPLIIRDLRCDTIIVNDGKCKIADFAHCTTQTYKLESQLEIQLAEVDVEKSTQLQFRSPEMVDLFSKRTIDMKSDIWCLGCVLYRLCYHKNPFEGVSANNVSSITNGAFVTPDTPKISSKLMNLLKECLCVDADMRPDIEETIQLAQSALRWVEDANTKKTELKLNLDKTLEKSGGSMRSPRDLISGLFKSPRGEDGGLKSFLSWKKRDPSEDPHDSKPSQSPTSDVPDSETLRTSDGDLDRKITPRQRGLTLPTAPLKSPRDHKPLPPSPRPTDSSTSK